MELAEIERLKAAAKAQRDLAIEKAKREYREAIAGIDAVGRLQKSLEKKGKRRGRTPGFVDEKALTGRLLKEIPSLGDSFTLDDLAEHFTDTDRGTLATSVRRLAESKNAIETVVAGRGRRKAVYRKIAP